MPTTDEMYAARQAEALRELQAAEGVMTGAEEAQLHHAVVKADAMYAGVIDAEAKIIAQANAILVANGRPPRPIPVVTEPASLSERLNRGIVAGLYLSDRTCLACGYGIVSMTQAVRMPTGFGDQLVHAPGACGLDDVVPTVPAPTPSSDADATGVPRAA